MKNSEIIQGAITFEEPFTIGSDGIYYNKHICYLKAGGDVTLRTSHAVCKALNRAYQQGFSNCADSALNKKE